MSVLSRTAARRRLAGALVLGFVLAALAIPAAADETGDLYSATVSVDATAANVLAARTRARHEGERQALGEVIAHLSGASAPTLAQLSDHQISAMVTSYKVANERMSSVRYLADYTFHFDASAVRRVMRDEGLTIGSAPGSAAPIIVLPVYDDGGKPVLWGDPNPWREAWRNSPQSGAGRFVVPLADTRALTTVDAARALAGRPDALSAIAQMDGGVDVVVAAATARRQNGALQGLDIAIARYRAGNPVGQQKETLSVQPGESESDFLARAVGATAALIGGGQSNPSANAAATPLSGEQSTLDAAVPIDSLADWIELRKRLRTLPAIRGIDLLSLSPSEAQVEITYIGTIASLKSGIAGIALHLDGDASAWRIDRAATAGVH